MDRKLLRELQRDPSRSVREIGEAVGLSHTPCWRRIKALQENGVIAQRYVIDPARLGYELNVFCLIRLKEHSRDALEEFERAVQRVPRVLQCYSVTGDHDYLLRVIAESVRDYEQAIKLSLVGLPHVGSISTSLTLNEIKNTMDVPV